ncbi:MAG TPA: hypothetical protein VMB73_04630 [Acetobacteraceae bacterium]|nr:hypothetical protein [Acetobacteraceae bacterium]
MRTVQVTDAVKDIVERHVATGAAASESDFIEQAVRRYAEDIDNDDEVIAAAEEGLGAIRRGEYTTIENSADAAAFWDGVWADALHISTQLRDGRSSDKNGAKSGG